MRADSLPIAVLPKPRVSMLFGRRQVDDRCISAWDLRPRERFRLHDRCMGLVGSRRL